MLPQPDVHILGTNPQFASLYNDLCLHKLNENGTSRIVNVKQIKERETFLAMLEKARIEEARKDVVRDALRSVAYRGPELPDELQEIIAVVSAQLDGKIDAADAEIVDGEVETFMEKIDTIAQTLGDHIENATLLLAQTANPSTTTATSLIPTLTSLFTNHKLSQQTLSKGRINLTSTLLSLLSLNRKLLESSIHILDRNIHGSVSRATRAQVAYLAAVAEGLSKKVLVTRGQVLGAVYDGEMRVVLGDKMEEVERGLAVLRRRVRERGVLLGELEQTRGLRDVVNEVRRVREEGERISGEVERLMAGRT